MFFTFAITSYLIIIIIQFDHHLEVLIIIMKCLVSDSDLA